MNFWIMPENIYLYMLLQNHIYLKVYLIKQNAACKAKAALNSAGYWKGSGYG